MLNFFRVAYILTQPHAWAFVIIGILCWAAWDQIVRLAIWLIKIVPKVILVLKNPKYRLKNWRQNRRRIEQVERLIQQAKAAINQDSYDPFNTDMLLKAIEYNWESYELIKNSSCLYAVDNIQIEVDRRHQFQSLFQTATDDIQHKQFRQALTNLFLAQELYTPQRLVESIAECQEYIQTEDIYLQSLSAAKTLSYAGKFDDALLLVNDAVAKFPNAEGESLQFRLNRVIAAKEELKLGKIEQKIGNLTTAKSHYSAALILIPEWSDPKFRLTMVEAQLAETDEGLDRLAEIDRPNVKYLVGLLYAQRQQYRKAESVWSKLTEIGFFLENQDLLKEYSQIRSNIPQAKSHLIQSQIQQLVEQGDFEQARVVSLDFVDRFNRNLLVENNLTNCILPNIEAKVWNTKEWDKIAVCARDQWSNTRDIRTLHNWAVALYYSTQIDDNIEELIIAWATAIANINLDPSLHNLSWLETKSISSLEIGDKLWQLLEQRIETIKDLDLPRYLHLRDLYRQEFWAIKLSSLEANAEIIVNGLRISPGCYQRYYSQITFSKEAEVWRTLYTSRGILVAAYLAGDSARAKTIEVSLEADSNRKKRYKYSNYSDNLEQFVSCFLLYQEGYYYLQQGDLQSGQVPLNSIKNAIHRYNEWHEQIEQLCIKYRSKISGLDENLKFAQFWYDLLGSPESENYLVEYRALNIQYKWGNLEISDSDLFCELQELLGNYPEHLVIKELYTQISKYYLKTESVEDLALEIYNRWNNSEVSDGISLARIRQLSNKYPGNSVIDELHQTIKEYYENPENGNYSIVEFQALRIQQRWNTSEVSDEISLIDIEQLLEQYPEHPLVEEIHNFIQEYYAR
jgi:hypothetical protein